MDEESEECFTQVAVGRSGDQVRVPIPLISCFKRAVVIDALVKKGFVLVFQAHHT